MISTSPTPIYDILIIGGGVNGCGIARDAVGRGLSVILAERDDLASGTSSSSTKLFHGGLRYLEHLEFRLVREALMEREVLLAAMPHISRPMRFVLPLSHAGKRPAWVVRLGLFLYDTIGGRRSLPGTATLDLRMGPEGQPLQSQYRRAYEYSDGWVDDARLVSLNARDAAERGAQILTRTEVTTMSRNPNHWAVTLRDTETGHTTTVNARTIVNAAGPQVADVIGIMHTKSKDHIRLVRGSHIVVPRLFDHDKAYFLQGTDGRIMFAIPYEGDFTLLGTTDADHQPGTPIVCSDAERDYILAFANQYFDRQLTPHDVVWTFAGVRPLHNDGSGTASKASRDYVLRLDTDGAPVLNVFGGKITTFRRLSEHAVDHLATVLQAQGVTSAAPWTAQSPLPGGTFPSFTALVADLQARYPFLPPAHVTRLAHAYGTDAAVLLGDATTIADLGQDFGATLSEREVRWLMAHEFARRAEDVTHRRTKMVLRLNKTQIAQLDAWMRAATPAVNQPT